MAARDMGWISDRLYTSTGVIRIDQLDCWQHPPQPRLLSPGNYGAPNPDSYFLQKMFVWSPGRMFQIPLKCNRCGSRLTRKGIYNRLREVVDVDCKYYLMTEYFECVRCIPHMTTMGWSDVILSQLDEGHRLIFPAILTQKLAIDKKVVKLLRSRTLGNSSNQLQNTLQELHSEEWMRKAIMYLSDCQQHISLATTGILQYARPAAYGPLPPPPQMHDARWLVTCLRNDALDRIEYVKGQLTSVFGRVLKMDSTKKLTKKLAGAAEGSASWVTNVANENGEILISVFTSGEGAKLERMAAGLVKRYKDAKQPPPDLLYVDRDCCSASGVPKSLKLFSPWKTIVRLDIWHFMRRFAVGCMTDNHPLYAPFLRSLSNCIFEWSAQDVQQLKSAKRRELIQQGMKNPTDSVVEKSITKGELALHCRRKTRGVKETTAMIRNLIQEMSGMTDSCGVPLIDKERMLRIWDTQQKHIPCIQDPEGYSLYTITGSLRKGGQDLTTYRCARGSTSLESFHLHQNRFVPGTRASDVNMQLYLLEGLARWNIDRGRDALEAPSPVRCYDTKMKLTLNALSTSVLGYDIIKDFQPPAKYTGELIGIEYLLGQTSVGKEMLVKEEERMEDLQAEDPLFADDLTLVDLQSTRLDVQEAEGKLSAGERLFPIPEEETQYEKEEEQQSSLLFPIPEEEQENRSSLLFPIPEEEQESRSSLPEEEQESPSSLLSSVDWRGIPGWDKVDRLTNHLLNFTEMSLTPDDVMTCIMLYDDLDDYDKQRTPRPYIEQQSALSGRFKKGKSKSTVSPDVERTRRSFLGAGVPAASPAINRIVEALCIKLCAKFRNPRKRGDVTGWNKVVDTYTLISQAVLGNGHLMERTNLVLPPINNATLRSWYHQRERRQDVTQLLLGATLPGAKLSTTPDLPEARPKPVQTSLPHGLVEMGVSLVENRAGQEVTPTRAKKGSAMPLSIQPSFAVPKSTSWYQKKRKAQEEEGTVGRYKMKKDFFACSSCGQPRRKETGHRQLKGYWHCPNSALSYEAWREITLQKINEKKEKK
ncbi:uncharacterized protein LOC106168072 [Lingula anatina]|uniref:Uncharacterized protein LOC106168072 n=1 Tax=Lingula anatina TaxID=7574 RepID=A0A1S3IY30_LINAN|nr:uncharacterized protein LOC106168072 [Lingula anatina]|eukprot:XP_013402454.1 uncharacterized protein LOC106168072 [Lingula anatina]